MCGNLPVDFYRKVYSPSHPIIILGRVKGLEIRELEFFSVIISIISKNNKRNRHYFESERIDSGFLWDGIRAGVPLGH